MNSPLSQGGKKRAEIVKTSTCKEAIAQAVGISAKNVHRTSAQETKDEQLRDQIGEIHKQHPSYGHVRVSIALGVNKKRVRRVMKKYGIKPPRRKSKRFCTTSTSHHTYTNLIKEWKPVRPNDLWCSDVSFIPFQGKWWYLATIVDIVTRQIIACQIGKHHNSNLILSTIEQAISKTKTTPHIFHTDQGTEFMAQTCTNYLENLGTKISASDKASPWQNGYQESFFGRFKDEFGDFNRFETIGELMEEIYSQIKYYNTQRIHRSLKMSPAAYAKSLSEISPPVWGT